MKRVLITGSNGFIGKAVMARLASTNSGMEIHSVGRSGQGNKDSVIHHRADLLNVADRKRLLEDVRPTHLIHLAWTSAPGLYWTDINNIEWLKASLDIARLFAENNGERCIFCGSSAEYDWNANEDLLSENSRVAPVSLYGAAKLALSEVISRLFVEMNVSWAWVRLFNPFGPHEHPQRLIPRVCVSLLKNEPLRFDSGQSIRDFLHVDDVADALISILKSPFDGTVNIASGVPVTVKSIIQQIGMHFNKSNLISFQQSGETGYRCRRYRAPADHFCMAA
jgi:nucleoside-diphosphate-sugar epimerase